ncbi:hypothetical protein RvY_03966 [Ramazzottius varieornatus]|uniref:Deltamethrin resistance protein prag01 domain-containing protein n=1 Tax=Ramazzottius varieornatus TaxID=947166 RepID=A0A1D1UVK5_RAMVA|nr:hypothetical protein RvY_03966 [Ramazzottius varieornatus]
MWGSLLFSTRLAGRRFASSVAAHGHGHAAPAKANMNSLVVPSGSWQTAYGKKQAEYTMQLVGSLAFLGLTCVYIWRVDPFQWEKVRKPKKFMHNPPAFDSPVLEPNVLAADYHANMPVEKVSVAVKK